VTGPTHRPRVTVVCLCYNTGAYAVKALDCVRGQTYPAVELVIVDDASSDGSAELLASWIERTGYPCRFIRHASNAGIPAVLNRALAVATGKYVTWISDDLWDEDRLETVTAAFEALPDDVGVLFGDAVVIDADDKPIGSLSPCRTLQLLGHPRAEVFCGSGPCVVIDRNAVREALFWRCFLPAPTVTVRRRVYDVIGPYDESLAVEDLDCWLRAARAFEFAYLRRPLVRYRVHPKNLSAGLSDAYLDSLAAILHRHRAEAAFPSTRHAVRRHLREEAYRVIHRLTGAGRRAQATRAFTRYYLPNLQLTMTALKETVRVCATLLQPRAAGARGPS
jgi:glycosyltransferase involved in cell wall biosynthesis